MKTIIQHYGPLTGSAANGTVSGRPNGSIYVPPTNTISLSTTSATFRQTVTGFFDIQAKFKVVAESQDPSNHMQKQVFSDSACTNLIATLTDFPGVFNTQGSLFAILLSGETYPNVGETAYFCAQLISVAGDAVATSSVVPLERIS